MKNTITIEDAPDHKLTYLIGVLVGMGLSYSIDPESPLYRTLREKKRERFLARKQPMPAFEKGGYRVFISGDSSALPTLTGSKVPTGSGEDIKCDIR